MKDVPKKIFLQVGAEDNYEGESFKAFSEVTWCSDKIHESDIEYILADPEGKEAVELGEWREEFKKAWERDNDFTDMPVAKIKAWSEAERHANQVFPYIKKYLYKIWKAEAK